MVKNSGYYRSLSDFLMDNSLVKEGYQFDLKIQNDPIPAGKYYLSASEGKLVSVGAGIRYDVTSLFTGRSKVEVALTPEIESASHARLQRELSKESLAHVSAGIKTTSQVRPLTAVEKAEFDNSLISQKYNQGKQLNKALIENARVVNRKVLSLDVESMVNEHSNRILHQDVFSIGMTESVDTTYSPQDKSLFQNDPRVRKASFKAQSAFDIQKTLNLFQQDVGQIEKTSVYGRQNLALVLDHVNKYVTGDVIPEGPDFQLRRRAILQKTFGSPDDIKSIQKRIVGSQHTSLESIMNISDPKRKDSALTSFIKSNTAHYGEKGDGIVNFLKNVSDQLIDNRLIKTSEAEAHSHHAGTWAEFSLGQVKVAETAIRAGGHSSISFKHDVMAGSVGNLFDAIQNKKASQVLTFGDAEFHVYKNYGNALEKELAMLKNVKSVENSDPKRIAAITETLEKLKTVKGAFVDVKERSEQLFDSLVPGIKQHLRDNATGVRSVFERLFGTENTHSIDQWGVERFLDQKHSGFSLENLYKVFKESKYTEWHTGGMDAADLGHFNLWLEDMLKNQRGFKAPSSQNMPGPGLAVLESNNVEMFNVTSRLARNIQSKTIISELIRNKSHDDVMGLVNKARLGGSAETREIIHSYLGNLISYKDKDDIRFKKDAVSLLHDTVNSELKDQSIRLRAQPTSHRFTAPEPGLLSKIVSSGTAGKFLAIAAAVYFGRKSAQEDPGASIETGEHNSTETTARRIATTPFGSSVSSLAAVITPFAKGLVANAERGAITSANYMGRARTFLGSMFDDISQVITDRTAMSPAVDSTVNRIEAKLTRGLDSDLGTYIPSIRREAELATQQTRTRGVEHYLNITNIRENRLTPRLTNPDNLAIHMEGINELNAYEFRDNFMIGNLPDRGSQNIQHIVPGKEVQTFAYGDPTDFIKTHQGLHMANDVARPIRRTGFVRPSFGGIKNLKFPDPVIDTSKIQIKNINDISKQAMFTPKPNRLDDTNISAMVVGMKQSKPTKTSIIIGQGNNSTYPDAMTIPGVLQNGSALNKDPSISSRALDIARDKVRDTGVMHEQTKHHIDKNMFTVSRSKHRNYSEIYFSNPKLGPVSPENFARVQRPVHAYQEQVNALLQKGTKVGYAS